MQVIDIPVKESLHNHLEKWDRGLDDASRCYGIKVCLAGADKEKLRDGLFHIGVRHISLSYFYARKWLKKKTAEEISDIFNKFSFVFLTSGCESLAKKNASNKVQIDPQKYIEEYYNELLRIGHIFAGCTEVDLGGDRELLNAELMRLTDEGVPIVPIIDGKPLRYYDDMGWFDDYPYIAVSGSVLTSKELVGYVNDLYRLCRERSVLLHGLGVSTSEILLQSRLYSISTSTWSSGAQFGATHIFEGGRLKYYQPENKDIRKTHQKRFEDAGLNWDAIRAGRTFEVSMMNGLAWRQLADYHQYKAPNAYWLTQAEKTKANQLKAKAIEGLADKAASLERVEDRRLALIDDTDEDGRLHEPLSCNLCNIRDGCPRYEPASICSYDINVRLRNAGDMRRMFRTILEAQYGRAMNGVLFEKVGGGSLNRDVSVEIQRLADIAATSAKMFNEKPAKSLPQKASERKPGGLGNMVAQVFTPTGQGTSGSGNSIVEREARVIESEESLDGMEE